MGIETLGTSLFLIDYSDKNKLFAYRKADLNEDSKSDSLIMKAVTGNIELMEAMAVLNTMEFNKPIQISNIAVLNPIYG